MTILCFFHNLTILAFRTEGRILVVVESTMILNKVPRRGCFYNVRCYSKRMAVARHSYLTDINSYFFHDAKSKKIVIFVTDIVEPQ